jgi:hypothetical protein
MKKFFTTYEAAAALNIEYKTLLARINAGTVKAQSFGRRGYIIDPLEIKRLQRAIKHDLNTTMAQSTR